MELFWADRIAKKIIKRKKWRYLDRKFNVTTYTVKSAASISGVLHIGRLSDTIRGESVVKALHDAGVKSRLIWVADDMDPLRKIPAGVPRKYSNYIGIPVTDVPDPEGCHDSWAEHHTSTYLEVLDKFIGVKMPKFSMREEYKKGSFKPYIKKLLANLEKIVEIQNKYRKGPLPAGWSPWQPVCENCGKIITPRVTHINDRVEYLCADYKFAQTVAKGCGHRGENDPLKGFGKLMYKSELAAQWARWGVVAEGFGKEYQVPGSAFWINAEIAEHVLDWPAPEPIFYEHLLIDGKKMSGSAGNVIYPAQWLEIASPSLLRFFYNKKLMKTRSFSWAEVPKIYDEYDYAERVHFGAEKAKNKKEQIHLSRLYRISQLDMPKYVPPQLPYTYAAIIAQVFKEKEGLARAMEWLRMHWYTKKMRKVRGEEEYVKQRLDLAKNWAMKYAENYRIKIQEKVPAEVKVALSPGQCVALQILARDLERKSWEEKELEKRIYDLRSKAGVSSKELFSAIYMTLLGKESGPRAAPFILALGQKRAAAILKQVSTQNQRFK
jgi:lysyl-tRNA synthetase class 1